MNLLANLRGRTLDPADLTVEEESSLIAIDRLVESDDERDVWLGLDILTTTEHPDLPDDSSASSWTNARRVRTDALERLVAVDPDAAADGRARPSRRSVAGGAGRRHPGARRGRASVGSRRRSRHARATLPPR